jgi:hypothetical protein
MNNNAPMKASQTVPLEEAVQQVRSRADLATFIGALLADLRERPDEWENRDLNDFLEALKAWILDMDGYYQNIGEKMPEQPGWKIIGQMLLAARIYE